ncbi:MAG: 16S rRNA (guanine(527)-N(7))-methyltransferase RsmG [Bacteroidetes bacterium]|nr:16S rRNA (guanine(527)-N(7))-methyltransferase RsmG [Bacteroidota bacterium]
MRLSDGQVQSLCQYMELLYEKNKVLNLISRQDIDHLEERHILHSLTIARYFDFKDASVMDVGSGGGLPGIPLAIYYPSARFTLVDARKKKVEAMQAFVDELGLSNVEVIHGRVEELKGNWHFVVSRGVASLPQFTQWVHRVIPLAHINGQATGIIYLRGLDFDFGAINDELHPNFDCNRIVHLERDFKLAFFSSKKLVFLQRI